MVEEKLSNWVFAAATMLPPEKLPKADPNPPPDRGFRVNGLYDSRAGNKFAGDFVPPADRWAIQDFAA
jgi:hypothetical protein